MSSDPIADFITKIRNAGLAHLAETEASYSKIKEEIAKILKKEGFIEDYKTEDGWLRVYLKYHNKYHVILGLKRISKPGLRRYAKIKDMPKDRVKIFILSTSQGLMTDAEAREKQLGGEIVCQIW